MLRWHENSIFSEYWSYLVLFGYRLYCLDLVWTKSFGATVQLKGISSINHVYAMINMVISTLDLDVKQTIANYKVV